jgi:hypothetical protein
LAGVARRAGLTELHVEAPTWDRRARRTVLSELRDDTAAFLKFAGKPADYWDLEQC